MKFIFDWQKQQKEAGSVELIGSKNDLASLCNFPTMPTISIVDCFPVGAERDVVDFRLDRLQRLKLIQTHTCFSLYFFFVFASISLFFKREKFLNTRSVNRSVSFFHIYFAANDPIGVYLHLRPPDDPVTYVSNVSSVTEQRFLYLACFRNDISHLIFVAFFIASVLPWIKIDRQ